MHKNKKRESYINYTVDLGAIEIPKDYIEPELTINEKDGPYLEGGDYSWKG